jgi:dTDP-glucose pyrophosphorylase
VDDGVYLVIPEGDETISRFLGDEWAGSPLRYARQPEPRGVGDAILRVQGLTSAHARLVVMGDVFFERSLAPQVRRWKRTGNDGAVLVEPIRRSHSAAVGIAKLKAGQLESVTKRVPTPRDRHRVAGMAILPGEIEQASGQLSPVEETGEIELEQLIRWLMGRGSTFAALSYAGWRRNLNTPEDLEAVGRRIQATDP